MALGGRPKEEGGHKRAKFSLNRETVEAIDEYRKNFKYKSKVVEEAIQLMKKARDPKKRRRLLKRYVKKDFEERKTLLENFNKAYREEAFALWFFEAVDGLLHCLKIAWNMKEREPDPAAQGYLDEYLDADLAVHTEYLKEGFEWIGKNANDRLLEYLKIIYRNSDGLYENIKRISQLITEIDQEKGELYEEYVKIQAKETAKRGIQVIDASNLKMELENLRKREENQ